MSDHIYTLPSGTELSVEAALGDLSRAVTALGEAQESYTFPGFWLVNYDEAQGLAADLGHVAELLRALDKPVTGFFLIYTSEYDDPVTMAGPYPSYDEALTVYWQRLIDSGTDLDDSMTKQELYATDDAVRIGRLG